VVNASPLIILSRIGRLDFLESLAPAVSVPDAVIAEVSAGLNHDSTAAATLQWAKERIVPNLLLPATVAAWGLGAGESQVIAHCLANPRTAVLDDQAGRACARAHGVSLVGTLGVLLLARQQGLIAQARPWVMRAHAAGLFLDPALIAKALASIGE
jgi:predicted nucleic acid-binding protein